MALVLPLLLAIVPIADAEAAPRVALVSRSAPAAASDKAYVSHLKQRGWDVTVIDDDRIRNFGKQAVAGFDLVVISSSVFYDRIEGRLLTAPEPILVAEHQVFRPMGLVDSTGRQAGLSNDWKTIDVVKPNSSLAAGYDGEVFVSSSAKEMNFGMVSPEADVIATVPNAPKRAVIFSYETGSLLASGERASGRRVGFFMSQVTPSLANADAWALFDASAAWLSSAAPQPQTIVRSVAAKVASGDPIAPDNGALLGANVSGGGFPKRYDAVIAHEKKLGRDLAIINRFHEFSSGLDSSFYWDRQHIQDGRTVMISWRATDNAGSTRGQPDPGRAKKIVAGQFDRQIEAMATALRDLEAPVLLRFNWEMDQDRGDPQYIGTASEFIEAWRYVHRKFDERGADNVEWVWAPRARSFAKNVGQTFYPGYDYVDWVGGSAVPINSYTDAQTIFGDWNQWAVNIGKPQLLWVGLRENPNDQRWKANFFEELRTLTSGLWVGVKAIVYYNSKSPLGNNYQIDTSTQSLQAFRKLACDPHFTKSDSC